MAFHDWGNPARVESEGEQTNPADEAVIADTGALARGNWKAVITVAASAAAQFKIARRNAANGADVGDLVGIYVPAGDTRQIVYATVLEPSERIVVRMDDALTGTAWAAINFEQLT